MKVDDLIANIGSGIARANRYNVIFDGALAGRTGESGERMSILCDSVTLPGRQVVTSDRFTSLKSIKIPYGYTNEDVNISFICPIDFTPYQFLYNWQREAFTNMGRGAEGDQRVRLRQRYVSDMQIQVLTNNKIAGNRPAHEITLKNAFPTSLNAIELGNANEDMIRVTATLTYDDWYDTRYN